MWEQQLRTRLEDFSWRHEGNELPVSIKIRATSGCFHGSCCPAAYRIIHESLDQYRDSREFQFVPHESGPELLTFAIVMAAVNGGTAVMNFSKSVIDLVTTIIKARSDGRKQGDKHDEPIELILRGFDKDGKLFEEKIIRIKSGETLSSDTVEKLLNVALQKNVASSANSRIEAKKQHPKKRGKPGKR